MPENVIYIPFPRKLYDDIVRFSDGRLDPVDLAERKVRSFVEDTFELGSNAVDYWDDRAEEVAEEYAPHVAERWRQEDQSAREERRAENKPLVWKEVTISAGSKVRMNYHGEHHYAEVKRGRILDEGKEYSPSEWASKVADNTTRNAWRDLWFQELLSEVWAPAQLLRDQAIEERERARAKSDGIGA